MRRGPIPISFEDAFPYGLGVVGAVTPQSDFQKSTRETPVQAFNEGVPVWVVDVMDFDPEAIERTFRVKITSKVQPVPRRPSPAPLFARWSWKGSPFSPTTRTSATVAPRWPTPGPPLASRHLSEPPDSRADVSLVAATVVVGLVVALLIKAGMARPAGGLACMLFGFMLALTPLGPHLQYAIAGFGHWIWKTLELL